MDLIDLTGRHTLLAVGAPQPDASSTYFNGSSALKVLGNPADFYFENASFTVEVDIWFDRSSNTGYINSEQSAWLDFVDGQWGWAAKCSYAAGGAPRTNWQPSNSIPGQNGSDLAFDIPSSQSAFARMAVCFDAESGITRYFSDGVLVATKTVTFTYPLHASRLLLGATYSYPDNTVAYPVKGWMRNLRITKAARYTAAYTPEDFATGDSDPYWSSTVLLLPLVKQPPSQRVTIDSMTADTAPGGDWTTYDGSAGRVVSGSISAALADGQSVTVSFDGGATWVTATTSGLSWSIIDPGEHVTSWIIVARVSAGTQSGPVTVRSVSLVPPPAEIENPYPPLVTSEHAVRPRFMATVEALTRPLVRAQSLIAAMPAAFDLDVAEGVQLDAVGLWVGRSRYLSIPISGAWFSFDVAGLGFDEGTWKGPFDATTGISRLDDGPYRLLLKARIAANQWDGTRQGAVDAWSVMFDGTGVTFQIQDNADMSMDVLVYTDHPLDAVTTALITGGYLGIKPSGVTINSYTVTEV